MDAKLRKRAESRRNHGQNWSPATFLKRPIPTSDSHKGAAVARSELNPPHPSFTTGAKRSRQCFVNPNSAELGELASPYPSAGLRESAARPHLRIFFSESAKFFVAFGCQSRLLGRSWALFGGFNTALGRSWLVFLLNIAPKELRRAILGDLSSILS